MAQVLGLRIWVSGGSVAPSPPPALFSPPPDGGKETESLPLRSVLAPRRPQPYRCTPSRDLSSNIRNIRFY